VRKFSSYGPLNTRLHYYAPRKALIERALTQLLGESPAEGGHYITVWAPRQTGKTWVMQQVLLSLRNDPQFQGFDIAVIPLEHLKMQSQVDKVVQEISQKIGSQLGLENVTANALDQFDNLFKKDRLKKPLILILDEFDALSEEAISGIVSVFRNIYISRQYQVDRPIRERDYQLHSVALVGVRAVLGVENVSGSPFNVQRSLHIPNLTFAEVAEIFKWYESESGQTIEPAVIERLYYETQGQPGLTCWFGELLTETYNRDPQKPITLDNFAEVFAMALNVLPNSNILNIISKARQAPYKQLVLEMFRTDERLPFQYDDQRINFLYLNGVIDWEQEETLEHYLKFANPFLQKRLFNYFSNDLFPNMGQLHAPFENLEDTITAEGLNIKNLMRRYEGYLKQNRSWLLKDAPRKTDLRIYEAVYHFNLYMYLVTFLRNRQGRVYPEFPTGNGKIDLIIQYANQMYGLELKSYSSEFAYQAALKQAARYGQQLQLAEIWLIFFVDHVDDASRKKYEAAYTGEAGGVTVHPILIETTA